MEVLNIFFSENKNPSHSLNRSGSRYLQVCLESVYPTVKLVLKLQAVDHNCSAQFSIQSWKTLKGHKKEISQAMRASEEKLIFVNDELKVFTQKMHDKCAVCFLDFSGVRVNIMLDTFDSMMRLNDKIVKAHENEIERINKTAANLEKFLDFILSRCNDPRQCIDVKQHINVLCNYSDPSVLPDLQTSDLSRNASSMDNDTEEENDDDEDRDDYDDDDEDRCSECGHSRNEYGYGRRRRGYW